MTDKENLSIETFSPAKADLLAIVKETQKTDMTSYEAVKENRIKLRDVRITITKKGKELRESALKFQKDVIAKEKELLGIVEPEEARLERTEEEMKLRKEMEARKNELPSRLEALKAIQDGVEKEDEKMLLAMDDNEFNEYRLRRIESKLTKDRVELEEKKKAEEAAKLEKEAKEEAERKAKVEAEDKARRDKLDAEDKERRAKLEAEEKALAEKRAAEDKAMSEERAKIAAEKARLDGIEEERKRAEAAKQKEIEQKEREAKVEADKEAERRKGERFAKFLKDNGYDEKTDILHANADNSGIGIYRKVAEMKYGE